MHLLVACRRGMAAGGPLWCCCPGAFGRGHASMAHSAPRSGTTDWYLWVSDLGSAGMGHRCSSSGVGRHNDMSCRLSEVSLLFYCNIFPNMLLHCMCEKGAYKHIYVHVDEILVWTWVARVEFLYCATTVVVNTQETDTDRCKDAFPIMDCLYIYICYCAYIMICVSPLVYFTVNKLLLLLQVVRGYFSLRTDRRTTQKHNASGA